MEIETHKITRKTQKKMSLTFKKKSEFLILLLYPVVSLMSHRHPTEKEDGGLLILEKSKEENGPIFNLNLVVFVGPSYSRSIEGNKV